MPNTYCNPLNLPYKFQIFRKTPFGNSINREAADPSVVRFKGLYYLFPSMSGGFWTSSDLHEWLFHETPELPIYDYAPDVKEIDGMLYFCASRRGENCPILKTTDPLNGKFEEVSRPFDFWDPDLFQDDDGRVYLYWGCSNQTPIWGVEMDRQTMLPIMERVELIHDGHIEHGWERIGNDNDNKKIETLMSRNFARMSGYRPFIEGPWMTKHNGRYYLQYAAPGTEYNTYADGVYISDHPLGPYVYAQNNPFCSKPGGFINGAGHGSTFQDEYGNFWHIATMRISHNHIFERRIGLFPAGFDADGEFFCNTNFADYPTVLPQNKIDPWKDTFAGWMLLSYQKPVRGSSSLGRYSPKYAVDEDIRTHWAAASKKPGEFITLDLEEVCTVNAVQINFADHKIKTHDSHGNDFHSSIGIQRHIETNATRTRFLLEGSSDGISWQILEDKRQAETDLPHDYLVFEPPIRLRFLRLTGFEMPYGSRFAVSGLRVFGKGNGALPMPVRARCERLGGLDALITWTHSAGDTGYNVRYGHAPDKLYHSWLVYGQTELHLGTLNDGQEYWVAVDAFNENGIVEGEVVKIA
jgi:hypothetical protein